QMEYFVSEDGVVLEHSAGYHEFGLALIERLIRYFTLLDREVPDEWIAKHARAVEFYRHLRRVDGTLPRHGDTRGRASEAMAVHGRRQAETFLSEDFGYFSARGGGHLLLTWANFPSRAHKHA